MARTDTSRLASHSLLVRGGGILLAIVLAVVVVAFLRSDDSASLEPESLVPALGTERTPEDELPAINPSGELVYDSTRLIGHDDTARYWVGLNDEDEICLLVGLDGHTSLTCAGAQRFYDRGLRLDITSNTVRRKAYLLPHDVNSTSLHDVAATEALVRETEALIAGPAGMDLPPTDLPRDTSESDFEFRG